MDALEQLRSAIPDAARDIRLNLQAVLRGGALTDAQRWSGGRRGGRRPRLREAVTSAASAAAGPAVVEDATTEGVRHIRYRSGVRSTHHTMNSIRIQLGNGKHAAGQPTRRCSSLSWFLVGTQPVEPMQDNPLPPITRSGRESRL